MKAANQPPDYLPLLVRRVLELVAVECRPKADGWEGRLAARLVADLFTIPGPGERLQSEFIQALALEVRELGRLVSPAGRQKAKAQTARPVRNYDEPA